MKNRDTVIKKIIQMPEERVLKLLIFMAGMEAEYTAKECENASYLNNTDKLQLFHKDIKKAPK